VSRIIDTPIDNIVTSSPSVSLDELLSTPVDASMSDDALCSLVSDANAIYLLLDEERGDTSSVMSVVDCLYRELARRINATSDIQHASPLLHALYDNIYGRDIESQGDDNQVYFYMEATARIVDSYRRRPALTPHDYIFHLTTMMPCLLPGELPAIRAEVASIIRRWTPYYDPALRCWTDCTPAESQRRSATLRRLRLYLPDLV